MSADKDSGMNFSYEEYEALLEKGKFEEAAAYKTQFLPNVLYKFVPLYDDTNLDKRIMESNNKRFSSLEREEIWFSSREAMNDPFEFTGIYIDEAKMRNSGWDADRLAKIKQDFLDSFFLASFTSNMSNNLPMWAHYANNHAGYCVKYKVGKIANVHRVLYLSKRHPIANGIAKFFGYGCMQNDVTASAEKRENARIEFQKCLALIQEMYTIKHTSWNYENEFRLFCDALQGEQGRNISAASVGLTPTDVYCGVNCSEKHIEKIQSISEKTGLHFHHCKLSQTDYLIID